MSHSNINRVVLVGRLTRDPELRALPSGRSVCSLRVASKGVTKDPEGEYQDKPNFFDVSVFGPQADSVDRYMRKGRRIAVDGRLQWREWESAEGQRRQAVDIVADSVEFLEGPGQQDGAADGSDLDGVDGELVGVGASADIPF